jgi:hypothetical protein
MRRDPPLDPARQSLNAASVASSFSAISRL